MDKKHSTVPANPNAPQKKKTREIWHPPLTAAHRRQNVALANAFLDRFGRD